MGERESGERGKRPTLTAMSEKFLPGGQYGGEDWDEFEIAWFRKHGHLPDQSPVENRLGRTPELQENDNV